MRPAGNQVLADLTVKIGVRNTDIYFWGFSPTMEQLLGMVSITLLFKSERKR